MGLAVALVAACQSSDAEAPETTVRFALDAPLCSSRLPVQFFIDGILIATDTFAVGLQPAHTTSRAFVTEPGYHTIGAKVIGGYVWRDTSKVLAVGEVFTHSLPFYCS